MIELLRPAGGDRARRLIAALLLVPIDERDDVVSAIEKRIVEVYDSGDGAVDAEALLHIAGDIVQRDGYTEQVVRSYARAGRPRADSAGSAREQA
ncbi:MAG: hypothetical protein RLN60_00370 [Phycisphaerales bacterium]